MATGTTEPGPGVEAAMVPARKRSWGRRVRWLRHGVQGGVAGLIAWQVAGHLTEGGPSAEGLCPFGGFETLWTWVTTGRTVPHVHTANLVLAAAVVLLALVGRGFFCGWICTLGALQGALYRAASGVVDRVPALRRRRRRFSRSAAAARWARVDRALRWGKWAVLVWSVVGAAITGTMVFRVADPWIALLSVVEFEVSLAFVVMFAVLLLSLVVQRPFCRYACPLGAVQSLIGRVSPIAIQREVSACLGCDLCNQACPVGIPVNTRSRVTDTSCLGCLECVAACPSVPALGVTLALPLPVRRGSRS